MAELTVCVPTPRVHFAECRSRDNVPVAALDLINSLAGVFEARNELRDVVWINVAQAKLSILIVFTHSVDKALLTDEEAKVLSARNSSDLDFVREGHLHRNTQLLASFSEWPRKGISVSAACERKIATACNRCDFQVLSAEEVDLGGLRNVLVVPETELAFLVSTPHHQIMTLLIEKHSAILRRRNLATLDLFSLLVLCHVCRRLLEVNLSNFAGLLYNNFVTVVGVLSALAIIIPSPSVDFTTSSASNRVRRAHRDLHDRSLARNVVFVNLHPLGCPRSAVHFADVGDHVHIGYAREQEHFLDRVGSLMLQ